MLLKVKVSKTKKENIVSFIKDIDEVILNVSDPEQCVKKVSYQIPSAVLEEALDKALRRIQPSVEIKGFRKGKAPLEIVRKNYGAKAHREVIQEVVQEAVRKTIEKLNLDILNRPEFNIVSAKEKEDLLFEVNYFVKPDIKVNYDLFEIPVKEEGEITDKDVDDVIWSFRVAQATKKKPALREDIREGDYVKGKIRAEKAWIVSKNEGGKKEEKELALTNQWKEFETVVGRGPLMKGIENALIGKKAGDKFQVKFQPEKDDIAHKEDEEIKQLLYSVEVEQVFELELPELTDDWAPKVMPTAKSLLDLRMAVRDMLEAKKKEAEEDVLMSIIANQ
ncbi:MAG: hypothetical protein D6780_01920 [Candidatus Dadabacteria bacterium]|nr:MAG: hypothetical protein D6780_01920 [Candidatus Dadabacteria bacterium]